MIMKFTIKNNYLDPPPKRKKKLCLTYLVEPGSFSLYINWLPLFNRSIFPFNKQAKGKMIWHFNVEIHNMMAWSWKPHANETYNSEKYCSTWSLAAYEEHNLLTVERSLLIAITRCWASNCGMSFWITWSVIPLGMRWHKATILVKRKTVQAHVTNSASTGSRGVKVAQRVHRVRTHAVSLRQAQQWERISW